MIQMFHNLRRVLRERLGVHFHWQNLDSEKRPGRTGVKNGRAWLTLGNPEFMGEEGPYSKDSYQERLRRHNASWWRRVFMPTAFSLQWVFGPRNAEMTHVYIETGEERPLKGSLAVKWLFGFYWGVSQPWMHKVLYVPSGRTRLDDPQGWYNPKRNWMDHELLKISVHDGCVWWSFFHPSHSWTSGTPWWRNHTFHVSDWFLGKPQYSSEVQSEVDVLVPMPEKAYKARAKVTLDSWRRRFHTTTIPRVQIDMLEDEQIPKPGKGENSYDCDEDALFSWCGPASTPEEAVGKVVESVLKDRGRRGRGAFTWRPDPQVATERALQKAGVPSSSHEPADSGLYIRARDSARGQEVKDV